MEVIGPTDTDKILSAPMIAELIVFASDTQARETVWFDVRE